MDVYVHTLHAFTRTKDGGNAAGVVLDANYLKEEEMQKIASILNYSETVYVQQKEEKLFKVRFFTPTHEVNICGHATIALFTLLLNQDIIGVGNFNMETKAGTYLIEVMPDHTIFMAQNLPRFYNEIDKREIADTLNIKETQFIEHLPIQIVSTGLKDVLVPVDSLDTLCNLKVNFERIAQISQKYNVVGYHVFTLETIQDAIAHCRNFAPLYGIPEEAATGTSNGALSCYLYKYGEINKKQSSILKFEQGYTMQQPSEILVSIHTIEEKLAAIKVGGRAIVTGQKKVHL